MPFVLDASIALAWCFDDEADHSTDAVLDLLREDTAFAPSLWSLEVANVLLLAERRRRITESQIAHFLRLLDGLPITLDLTLHPRQVLIDAGRRHSLTAYDACYLVTAQSFGLPLATRDADLRAAAKRAGVALLP